MLFNCKQSNYHDKSDKCKYVPSTLCRTDTNDCDFSIWNRKLKIFIICWKSMTVFVIALSILLANKVTLYDAINCQQSKYHGRCDKVKYIPWSLMIVLAVIQTGNWDYFIICGKLMTVFVVALSILLPNRVFLCHALQLQTI